MGAEQGKQAKCTTFVGKIIRRVSVLLPWNQGSLHNKKKLVFNFVLGKQRPEKYSSIFKAIYRRGSFDAVFSDFSPVRERL